MAKLKDGIIKRGSTWSYVLRVPDPKSGTTKPKWFGGFATAREAKEARDKARARLGDGLWVEPSKVTVADYLRDRWLPAMEATGKRATTMRSYHMHVDQHIAPRIGSQRLQAVSGDMLNALYAELLATGRSDGRGGLSPATVRRVHAVMTKALSDAVRWSLLVRNPAKAADPPKAKGSGNGGHDTWTADQLATFLRFVAEDRLSPLWRLLATTGMRRGEAVGLRWDDVDLSSARVAIRQSIVAVGYEPQLSGPKTARGRRSVALDRKTVASLRAWRAQQARERLALGPAWVETGLVFTREDGTGWHPDRISKLFNRHVARAGLKRIRLHDLRHTYATLGLAAGVHPKLMSERLGHSTVSFTLDTYTASVPELDHDVAERIADLLVDDETG
jgi:integrase